MPPSLQHAIRNDHHMTNVVHPIIILDDDDVDYFRTNLINREESTSLTSLPPAFNPEFVKTPAMAPVTIQTAEQVTQVAVKASDAMAPVPAQTVDPFIAAVFAHGFENVQVEDRNDSCPRSCLDQEILAERTIVSSEDRLEKRFVQEPRRAKEASSDSISHGTLKITAATDDIDDKPEIIDLTLNEEEEAGSCTIPSTATTCSAALVPALMVPAVTGLDEARDGTKANPPSAPRFIPLTRQATPYVQPYSQVVLWKTQLFTRAALDRGLRLHQRHGPTVNKVVKKSWKAIRKASQKGVALAVHHGPIVGRKLKRASIRAIETVQEFEANHQLLAKSKSGLYDVWSRQRGTRASF